MLGRLAGALGAGVCVAAVAVAAPAPAYAQSRAWNVPGGSLKNALDAFARQSGRQVIYRVDDVRGARSRGARGPMAPDAALDAILAGTGFIARTDSSGAIAIVRVGEAGAGSAAADDGSADQAAIAEILVVGSRTQNADIRRSEDDSQPYMVIDRSEIERSGAGDLESLLRQQLTMQSSAATSRQGPATEGNISSIDLRGLGSDETLILIDGRRVAGRSAFGRAEQPDINAIPISAIERIEILPSTASGIYGGGATGGVINIIYKRDYSGVDAQLTYGNTSDFQASERRLDVNGGFSLNGGRTRLMFSGSYAASGDLLVSERDFVERGRARILANNPNAFFNMSSPPIGATANIRRLSAGSLTLDARFGGASIGSRFTSVPLGYAGPGSDNGAALIANAGRYNLDLANSAQVVAGANRSIVNAPTIASARASVNHEFTPGLSLFLEGSYSENRGSFLSNGASTTFFLPGSAPGNPFQETVAVTVPAIGADQETRSVSTSVRLISGLVAQLPYEWRAALDLTFERARFRSRESAGLDARAAVTAGTIDVFRDLNTSGAVFGPYLYPQATYGPSSSTTLAVAARIGGPLPLTLPGGRPMATFLLEHRDENLGEFIIASPGVVATNFPRSQDVTSLYGEIRLPVIGSGTELPLVHELELQLAGRVDHYKLRGSNQSLDFSPTPETVTERGFTSINPTISLKWMPFASLTLRGSYGTGFLPPALDQLTPNVALVDPAANFEFFGITDPLRGGEPLGDVLVRSGGSPNLRPERSRSWSLGAVLAPEGVAGLRFSADWTRITKSDNIASLQPNTAQADLETLILFAPDRIVRNSNPATFGSFGVGPITEINQTLINLSRARFEAIDFAAGYRFSAARWGDFSLAARATRLLTNRSRLVAEAPVQDNFGLRNTVRWNGNLTIGWTAGGFSAAWTTRYISSYFLNPAHSVNLNQGSDRIPSQLYHDLVVRYVLGRESGPSLQRGLELGASVTNIFDTTPPVDVSETYATYYSTWGDPRGAAFRVWIRKSF